MKTLVMLPSMVTMMVVMMMIMTVKSQRRVVGDIREQSISQLADFDAREERVFRCVVETFTWHSKRFPKS